MPNRVHLTGFTFDRPAVPHYWFHRRRLLRNKVTEIMVAPTGRPLSVQQQPSAAEVHTGQTPSSDVSAKLLADLSDGQVAIIQGTGL